MKGDWQTWTVYAVVLATVGIMLYRILFKKKAGCEGSCGCAGKKLGPTNRARTSGSGK